MHGILTTVFSYHFSQSNGWAIDARAQHFDRILHDVLTMCYKVYWSSHTVFWQCLKNYKLCTRHYFSFSKNDVMHIILFKLILGWGEFSTFFYVLTYASHKIFNKIIVQNIFFINILEVYMCALFSNDTYIYSIFSVEWHSHTLSFENCWWLLLLGRRQRNSVANRRFNRSFCSKQPFFFLAWCFSWPIFWHNYILWLIINYYYIYWLILS